MTSVNLVSSQVQTGIPGFDELVQGGLPKGKAIVLTGTPGTGKTIFSLQFAYFGAKKGEQVLYVSLEENSTNLKNQASQFQWDLTTLEKEGSLKFLDIAPTGINESTVSDLFRLIEKKKFDRVVIDSMTALAINTPSVMHDPNQLTDISIRRFIHQFVFRLRKTGTTSLLIAHKVPGIIDSIDFVSDGLIRINHEPMGGKFNRNITIQKMREIANDEDIHPLEISNSGITVHTLQ